MTHPTIIQTPGAAQFLQQGFEQGTAIRQRQQQLDLEKERTQAEISARSKGLELEERQVAANEAFRRGYASYLQSRGEYYSARANQIKQKDEDTRTFISSIKDPETRFMANLALVDPRVSSFLGQQMGQQGHMLTLAGNLWLHSGITMDKAKQTVGLTPKPGDETLRAPLPVSRLNAQSQAQSRKLATEAAAIKAQLDAAQRYRQQFITTAQGSALMSSDPKQRARFASPESITAAADSATNVKFPNMDKLNARWNEIQSELMGMFTPQAGGAAGQGQAPVIPDTFGGATGGVDMQQLNDIIERQNEMFDNMQDMNLGNVGGDNVPNPQQ
jgi:hypothetical protein